MQSNKSRLDRFISAKTGIKKSDVRLLLAQGRVFIDGVKAVQVNQVIDQFTHVRLDHQLLQAENPIYLMMHKPVGVVSATKDEQHTTVIDLLEPRYQDLHIAGRLDLNSSGLLLLTNHGDWSRKLSSPESKVSKVYEVTLENPLTEEYIEAFAAGFYFEYEGITTQPAKLEILSDYQARVTLMEGKYHQIKRMFGRFRNPVLKLHRTSIGTVKLDGTLAVGESRELTKEELTSLADR